MQTPPHHATTDPDEIQDILGISHHFMDGLYAKRITLKQGASFGKHTHSFTHVSIVAQGVARVQAGDVFTDYRKGDPVVILAGVAHSVVALEDLVWFCIHATDETDSSKIDTTLTSE